MSGSSSSASAEFKSAHEHQLGEAMEEDDVFENSALFGIKEEMDNDNDRPASTAASTSTGMSSSLVSSKNSEDIARRKLPKEYASIFQDKYGMLYMERYTSFIDNNWPYDVKKGNLCHPRALALAGLKFNSLEPSPTAECAICLRKFHNLEHNSNPWILHAEANPECYLVKLGQRDEVDDYSMDELVEMSIFRIVVAAEKRVKEKETDIKKQLYALRKMEMDGVKELAS